MRVKPTNPVSLEELWNFEATHPVVFASPRALAEARLIAALKRSKPARHTHKNGFHSRRRRKLAESLNRE